MKNKKDKNVKTYLIIDTTNSHEFSPGRLLVPEEDVWNSFACEEKNFAEVLRTLSAPYPNDMV